MNPEKISRLKIVQKEQTRAHSRFWMKFAGALAVAAALAGVGVVLHSMGLLTPTVPVKVGAAAWIYPSQLITDFNASGYVVPQRKAAVSSKGTGRIEYLGVREGSRVRAGEVLARLENEDLVAERAQVEAQLAAARAEMTRMETDLHTAERNLKRYQNLWDHKAVAQADFENSQDQHKRGRAAVEAARANIKALEASLRRLSVLIEYTHIRAPFDGVVLTKDADVGEVVAPFGSASSAKAAVVTMADMESLMVQTDVAESFLSKVREGQACEIQLDSLPENRFPGKVATIVPTADRTRGTVLVKVRFDRLDPRILPEMSARVAFLSRPVAEAESRPFLGVHREGYIKQNEAGGVFKLDNDTVRWLPFPSPVFMGDYLLAGDALHAGDRVVTKPPPGLKDGDRVKIED